jgi:hypothetical protein
MEVTAVGQMKITQTISGQEYIIIKLPDQLYQRHQTIFQIYLVILLALEGTNMKMATVTTIMATTSALLKAMTPSPSYTPGRHLLTSLTKTAAST